MKGKSKIFGLIHHVTFVLLKMSIKEQKEIRTSTKREKGEIPFHFVTCQKNIKPISHERMTVDRNNQIKRNNTTKSETLEANFPL